MVFPLQVCAYMCEKSVKVRQSVTDLSIVCTRENCMTKIAIALVRHFQLPLVWRPNLLKYDHVQE